MGAGEGLGHMLSALRFLCLWAVEGVRLHFKKGLSSRSSHSRGLLLRVAAALTPCSARHPCSCRGQVQAIQGGAGAKLAAN
jgi:hypothetical protein